jgi:hypothetical protein
MVIALTDVRASLMVARWKTRARNPDGDAERLARSDRTYRRENPLGSQKAVRTKTDTGG